MTTSRNRSIALHAERLEPIRRATSRTAVVRKKVVTREESITVAVSRERLAVSRRRVHREVDTLPEPYRIGDTHYVPVVAVIGNSGRMVVFGEVMLTVIRETDYVTHSAPVRHEMIEVQYGDTAGGRVGAHRRR